MRINRKKFYDNYRIQFGKLNQNLVNNLNFLLAKLETGLFKLPTQMVYELATAKHETNDTFYPVVEGYWIKGNRKKVLYNYYINHNPHALRTIFPFGYDSNLTYEGRGYIQTTHNFNYLKFGLADNPEKAAEPETAFMIMEKGFANGMFTGKKLQDYINEDKTDYFDARKCVNGIDRASLIAGYARQFEWCIELVPDELAMAGFNQESFIEV